MTAYKIIGSCATNEVKVAEFKLLPPKNTSAGIAIAISEVMAYLKEVYPETEFNLVPVAYCISGDGSRKLTRLCAVSK